jgi:hypothetical protein
MSVNYKRLAMAQRAIILPANRHQRLCFLCCFLRSESVINGQLAAIRGYQPLYLFHLVAPSVIASNASTLGMPVSTFVFPVGLPTLPFRHLPQAFLRLRSGLPPLQTAEVVCP